MNRILRSQLPQNPRDIAVFDTTTGSSPRRTRGAVMKGFLTFIILFLGAIGFVSAQTYYAPGSYTWTCPAGVTSITVQAWGAGGGGGGGAAVANAAGGGGGGGAYAQSTIAVVPGTAYTIIVGSVGTAGASTGANGAAGGNSSFGTTLVVAAGGSGGSGTTITTPGAGGAGGAIASSTGTIVYAGGAGATGIAASQGGGGGSVAYFTGNGNTATNGTGATALAEGGAGGNGGTTNVGVAGGPGSGGGGGRRSSGISRAGGSGGAGRVTVYYTDPVTTIPFLNSFAVGNLGANWYASEFVAGTALHWDAVASDPTYGPTAPAAGAAFARLNVYNAYTTYNPYYLTSQAFTVPATGYKLIYNYWLGSAGGASPLVVQISSNGGEWTNLWTHATTEGTNTWLSKTIDLDAYNGQSIRIRFRGTSNYGSGTCDMAVDEIQITQPCSGTPNAGIASLTMASSCYGSGFSLSASGLTSSPGMSYQWQSSPDNSTWTNISGGATSSYAASAQSALTYYQLVSTCSFGGGSSTSSSVSYTPIEAVSVPYLNSFADSNLGSCWSASEAVAGSSSHWQSVTADAAHGAGAPYTSTHFARLDVFNAYTTYNPYYLTTPLFNVPASGYHLNYRYWLGSAGNTAPLVLQISDNGGAYTALVTHTTAEGTNQWLLKDVDLSAYAGHLVKFRYVATSNYGSGSCNLGIDEFQIAQLCSGSPSISVAAMTTVGPVCSQAVVMSASGFSQDIGITNQWQVSTTSGGSYTNVTGGSGANSATYTSAPLSAGTYYYVLASTCSNGGASSSSAEISITILDTPPTPVFSANSGVSTTGFTANWGASAGATSYILDVSTSNTFATNLVGYDAVNVGNVTSYPITSLNPNTNYYVRVRATNGTCTSANATALNVYTGYCIPTSNCTFGDVIASVVLNTLSNSTGTACSTAPAGYSDFTGNPALTTTLLPSSSYTITVGANAYAQSVAVWIDYNDDLVFDNVTERVGATLAGSPIPVNGTASFTITLGCTPPAGVHRMRIRSSDNSFVNGPAQTPCAAYLYGQTEDYLITIQAPPACPSPGALVASGNTLSSATFSWTLGCSTATNYDFEYGPAGFTPGSGTLLTNQAATISSGSGSYTLSGLTANTSYDVYFRANCGGSESQWSPLVNVYTGYCVASSTSTLAWLSNVATTSGLTNFNNTTALSTNGYGDYTSTLSVSEFPGSSFTLSANYNTIYGPSGYYYFAKVWVDWNNDLDFNDAGETMYTSPLLFGTNPLSASMTVPAGQPIGNYRMRVRLDMGTSYQDGILNPCGSFTYGETEDYTLTVTPIPLAPTLASVDPSEACPGSTIAVTGTEFIAVSAVNFVELSTSISTPATSYSVTSPTQMSVVMPQGLPGGVYDLIVTNITGSGSSLFIAKQGATTSITGNTAICGTAPATLNASGTGTFAWTSAATSTYSIRLNDTWGDSWNGGAVNVIVDGTTVVTGGTVATGYGPVYYNFSVSPGSTIVVNYTAALYPTENNYTVFSGSNGSGTALFASTVGLAPPASQTVTVSSIGTATMTSAGSSSSVTTTTAGWYSVVFTDGTTGCQATASATIQSRPVPVVTAPIQVSACTNGNATITASSDIPVLSYTWTSLSTSVSTNTTSGTLTVGPMASDDLYSIVASTQYCSSAPAYEGIAVVGLSGVVLTPINLTCNGAGNGSFALASFSCGTTPFTYSAVATGAAVGTFGPIPTNLAAGTYDVYVTDADGNFTNSPIAVTITEPALITAATTSVNAIACSGVTTGNVSATALVTGTKSVSSGALTSAINDNATTTSALSVSGIPAGATLTGISVNFDITHTFDGDLDLSLIGPGGVSVNLSSDNGGGSPNYTNTTISSASSNPITGGSAPFTGTYSPEGDLSTLFSNTNGNWTFSAADDASGDVGTLTGWSLTLNYSYPSTADIKWYSDAAATNVIGTGGTLNVVGTSFCPSPAASGVYTVYAAYTQGVCTGPIASATLTVSGLSGVVLTPSNLTCYGSNDGTFSQTQTCGTAPYTYSVVASGNPAGAYGALPTNLAAGSYSVYIKDAANELAGPFALSLTQPDALPTSVTTGGTACEFETVGNVTAVSMATGSVSGTFGANLQSPGSATNFGPITLSVPAGATITGGSLVMTNINAINGSYLSEIEVTLSGGVTLATTTISSTNGPGNIPSFTIDLPAGTISGGAVTLTLSEDFNDGGNGTIDATFANVQLVLNYSQSFNTTWYEDAAGTIVIGSGSTLDVIGTSACPSPAASGTYTVYAAASNASCNGTLVPANLVVGAPLTVSVTPVVNAYVTSTPLSNYALAAGFYTNPTQSLSIPAGATILSASLDFTNVSTVGGTWSSTFDSDITVAITGSITLNSVAFGSSDVILTGEDLSFPITVNPAGGSYTMTLTNNSWAGGDLTFDDATISVFYSLPATGAVCPGAVVVLNATTIGGGGTQTITWSNNGTQIGTGTSFTTIVSDGDSYTANVTDGCNTTAVVSSPYVPTFESLNGGTISGTTSIMTNDVTATNPGIGSYTLTGQTAGHTISWLSSTTSATGPWATVGGSLNTQNLNFTGLNGTYYIAAQITSAGGCTAISNALAVSVGVLNDNACDAIALTMGNQGGYAYTTQGSTVQAGETAGYGAASGSTASIWFKFVAPASGHVSIQSSDAGVTDNYMRIYSATDCSSFASFTQLFSDDDSGANLNAFIQNAKCLIPGQTYYVQVSQWSAGDALGSYVITVTDLGNIAPKINNDIALSNITQNVTAGTCGRAVTWVAPSVTDDQSCVTTVSNYVSGATFPVGTTTVTYTATDAQGFVTTSSFTVTIVDNIAPTVTPPAAVTVTAALNSCTATAALGSATSVDNCGVTASATNNAPATFQIGNTTVTWSVIDVNGNVGTATQVVTVNIDPTNLWYVDTDGDGFGAGASLLACSQPAGYAANTTDCNDANVNVNPGEIEICGNTIDDNCNGASEEGCLNPGENPSNATSMSTSIWPNCNAINGTLVNATVSGSAQTICLTGEDKWHQFVATSEGVSIVVNSSAADIVIELQTAAGVLVAQENAVSGLGGEILNHNGLTAGQVYKIGVRNYNSALGTGTYSICAKMLKRGGCDYGPGPYTLCQYFKATWAGATGTSYTYTFTGLTGPAAGNVYTRTQNTDICVLSNVVPTLPYGSTYNLLITNTYTITNAAGVAETISVPALAPCSMSTAATDQTTALRTTDRCAAGPRFRGAIVASLPWVCGATNWRWEFTELDAQSQPVGLSIYVNRGAASNYLSLGTVLQLQYGKTYSVRTAPILSYTGSDYQWGAPVCMSIIGTAGMIADGQDASESTLKVEIANEVNMSLYPNPTHGTDVNINLSGVESDNVQIRVIDAMGRQVWSNRYSVNGVLNTNITFEQPLANGLYMVEAIFNGEVQTQRLMVQK